MNQNYDLSHLKDYIFSDISKNELKEHLVAEMEGFSLQLIGEENDILFTELNYQKKQGKGGSRQFTQKLFFKFEESSDEVKIMTYFDATLMNKILKIINIAVPVIDVFIAIMLVFFFIQRGDSEMGGVIVTTILIFSIFPMIIIRKVIPKSFKSNLLQFSDRMMQNLLSIKHVK